MIIRLQRRTPLNFAWIEIVAIFSIQMWGKENLKRGAYRLVVRVYRSISHSLVLINTSYRVSEGWA